MYVVSQDYYLTSIIRTQAPVKEHWHLLKNLLFPAGTGNRILSFTAVLLRLHIYMSSLQRYQKERLRQASWSFNTFLGLSIITGLVSLLGIALLIVGKVQPGVITTTGGISSNIVSVRLLKLTKESNVLLDKTFNKSLGGNEASQKSIREE